jgi:hypothetical protein
MTGTLHESSPSVGLTTRRPRLIGLILAVFTVACSSTNSSARTLYWNPLDSLDTILTRTGVTLDKTISNGGKGTIRIDVNGPTTIRLAEIGTEQPQAVLVYRGHLRAAKLRGHAYLEMRCSIPGQGEFASRATAVTGTTDWVSQVARFVAERGPGVRTVKLNMVADGNGIVWVRTIALFGQAAR